MRGYIAMLAVQAEHRGRGIGNVKSRVNSSDREATQLVESALAAMIKKGADEVRLLRKLITNTTDMPGNGND